MGITERRGREKEEVRKKILDAARDLFTSEGYERVTMRRIAESIEYSPTTIYHHFEDKEDLVKCLCEEDFTKLLEALQARALPALPEDSLERLKQLGQSYAQFGLENPNHYRFMFMTPRKPTHEPSSSGAQAYRLFRSAVEAAIASQQFREMDPDTIAQVLWASLHGAVALLITSKPEEFPAPPVPDLIQQIIDHGCRGFLNPTKDQD